MSKDEPKYNPFIYNKVFPTPEISFARRHKTLDAIKDSALYVLDTNALFVPYGVSTSSLVDIRKIYQKLIDSQRIKIPKQCIREFLKNRPNKIKEVHEHINQAFSNIPPSAKDIPCSNLEGLSEYTECKNASERIKDAIKGYRQALDKLRTKVKSWNFTDPISEMYASVFSSGSFIDHKLSDQDLIADRDIRHQHTLPPGYKDKTKEDGGIGDVAIWHAIVELGREKKKDVIFVSNDEKPDWVVRAADQSICARYELVDEFYQASGAEFIIIPFVRFLEIHRADEATIRQTQDVAFKSSIEQNITARQPQNLSELSLLNEELNHMLNRLSEYESDFEDEHIHGGAILLFDNDFIHLAYKTINLIHSSEASFTESPILAGQFRKLRSILNTLLSGNERLKDALMNPDMDAFEDEKSKQLTWIERAIHSVHITQGIIEKALRIR